MSIKQIVSIQYQGTVNRAGQQVRGLSTPPEGWLCTARKALQMSGARLAERLGVSRAQVSKTEKSELSGRVTIKTMQKMAEAMECRFVYAIVPEKSVEEVITAQARKKAEAIVEYTHQHMMLEGQALSDRQIAFEVERLITNMVDQQPADFWDDKSGY
ncbi:hypothetical protein MNBD_GAMMA11-509 [hydrothermal vent metagenome]|uniref:HTH cro/C1-type domain-containing protein n=1 Tax=hydrothermal vent metagenome TaxID=652676 RepID=A0A3B0WYF9_9ZZZZ